MLKKNITYTNPFTEQEVTEEYYFHLSKADLAEMQLVESREKYTTKDGRELEGMQAKLQRMIDAEDSKAIIEVTKDMIRRSYGKKVGDRFVKTDEAWQEFSSSEAYSQLFFELCTDAVKSAEFMSGIVPSNLEAEVSKLVAQTRVDETIAAVEKVADATGADFPKDVDVPGSDAWAAKRKPVIAAATPENPIELSPDELTLMTSEDLKAGLQSGAYKLS